MSPPHRFHSLGVMSAVVIIAVSAGAAVRQRSIVFIHATVIDATAPARSNQTVVITGERIVAVGPSSAVKVPSGSRVVDATGRFLIPGLWDAHVHTRYDGVDHLRRGDAPRHASRYPTESGSLDREADRTMTIGYGWRDRKTGDKARSLFLSSLNRGESLTARSRHEERVLHSRFAVTTNAPLNIFNGTTRPNVTGQDWRGPTAGGEFNPLVDRFLNRRRSCSRSASWVTRLASMAMCGASVIWGATNTDFSSTNFGLINSQANSPRQMQIGLKLYW